MEEIKQKLDAINASSPVKSEVILWDQLGVMSNRESLVKKTIRISVPGILYSPRQMPSSAYTFYIDLEAGDEWMVFIKKIINVIKDQIKIKVCDKTIVTFGPYPGVCYSPEILKEKPFGIVTDTIFLLSVVYDPAETKGVDMYAQEQMFCLKCGIHFAGVNPIFTKGFAFCSKLCSEMEVSKYWERYEICSQIQYAEFHLQNTKFLIPVRKTNTLLELHDIAGIYISYFVIYSIGMPEAKYLANLSVNRTSIIDLETYGNVTIGEIQEKCLLLPKFRVHSVHAGADKVSAFRRESCSYCDSDICPKKCGACKSTLYCNQECQKNDWPVHKAWCKYLKSK